MCLSAPQCKKSGNSCGAKSFSVLFLGKQEQHIKEMMLTFCLAGNLTDDIVSVGERILKVKKHIPYQDLH